MGSVARVSLLVLTVQNNSTSLTEILCVNLSVCRQPQLWNQAVGRDEHEFAVYPATVNRIISNGDASPLTEPITEQ